jgi:1-acyl-sn-glycerol-3-phosphate acyltransferase
MQEPKPQKNNTPPPIHLLNLKEKIIFKIVWFTNKYLNWYTILHQRIVRFFFNRFFLRHTKTFNIERLANYPKSSTIILAANHRTYYDNFIVMTQLYNNHKQLPRRCLFPNRSTFYFDTFRGLFTNLIGTGLALFPPIYRQRHQYKFNRFSMDYMVEQLCDKKGIIIAIHPEGTRNDSPDPYSLVKAKTGVGELAIKSPDSILIPIFIHGLSNSLKQEIKYNYSRKSSSQVSVMFGEAIKLDDLRQQEHTKATYRQATERWVAAINQLAQEHQKTQAE